MFLYSLQLQWLVSSLYLDSSRTKPPKTVFTHNTSSVRTFITPRRAKGTAKADDETYFPLRALNFKLLFSASSLLLGFARSESQIKDIHSVTNMRNLRFSTAATFSQSSTQDDSAAENEQALLHQLAVLRAVEEDTNSSNIMSSSGLVGTLAQTMNATKYWVPPKEEQPSSDASASAKADYQDGANDQLILAVLVAMIVILSLIFLYLIVPPLIRTIHRKYFYRVDPKHVEARYRTIEGWLISKVRNALFSLLLVALCRVCHSHGLFSIAACSCPYT